MNRAQKKAIKSKMADFVRGKLAPHEALDVIDAVERDRELSADLDLHVELQNFARSDDALEAADFPEVSSTAARVPRFPRSWWEQVFGGRRLLVPAGSLLLIVAGVAVFTLLQRAANPYSDLADLGDPAASFRMRGASEAELADASNRFLEGDARESAYRFERYLRMYPSSEWAPWVEYAAGISRLAGAREKVFGIGVRYDEKEVRGGLEHLDRVLAGPAVPELVEDALWYRAKGFLMLGDAGSAEAQLNQILALQGSRQVVARKLLSDLQSLHR